MEETTKICKDCKLEKSIDDFRLILKTKNNNHYIAYSSYCKRCDAIRQKTSIKNLKLKIINIYSNGSNSCVCCGETNIEFLSIDHINNGRGNPRIRLSGNSYYHVLKKQGFPRDNIQILCYNCNCSKGFLGYCPHQKFNSIDNLFSLRYQ